MRVGVIGAGFIGAIHLGAYANMPDVEVDGLRALEIVLAAYSSGEDHEPETVQRAEVGD
jgi:predicted dehydrogenase